MQPKTGLAPKNSDTWFYEHQHQQRHHASVKGLDLMPQRECLLAEACGSVEPARQAGVVLLPARHTEVIFSLIQE